MSRNHNKYPIAVILSVSNNQNGALNMACISFEETMWNEETFRVYTANSSYSKVTKLKMNQSYEAERGYAKITLEVDADFPIEIGAIITTDVDMDETVHVYEKAYSMYYYKLMEQDNIKKVMDHYFTSHAHYYVECLIDDKRFTNYRYLLNPNNEPYLALYTSVDELLSATNDETLMTLLDYDQVYEWLLMNQHLRGVVINPMTDNLVFSDANIRSFFWHKKKATVGSFGYHISTSDAIKLIQPELASTTLTSLVEVLTSLSCINQVWVCQRESYGKITTLSIRSDENIESFIGELMERFKETQIDLIDVVSSDTKLGKIIAEIGLCIVPSMNEEDIHCETWN